MINVLQFDSAVSLLMTVNSLSTANKTLISGQLSVATFPELLWSLVHRNWKAGNTRSAGFTRRMLSCRSQGL